MDLKYLAQRTEHLMWLTKRRLSFLNDLPHTSNRAP